MTKSTKKTMLTLQHPESKHVSKHVTKESTLRRCVAGQRVKGISLLKLFKEQSEKAGKEITSANQSDIKGRNCSISESTLPWCGAGQRVEGISLLKLFKEHSEKAGEEIATTNQPVMEGENIGTLIPTDGSKPTLSKNDEKLLPSSLPKMKIRTGWRKVVVDRPKKPIRRWRVAKGCSKKSSWKSAVWSPKTKMIWRDAFWHPRKITYWIFESEA